MKKTAVEWLVEQFNTTINYTLEEYEKKVQQAKEMEKEQMKEIREMLVQGALTNMSCASAVVEFDRLTKQQKQ